MVIHYRTKGIFIKKEDRGEADQLFTIYTGGFGKLKVLGKGIRKIKSKLRSGAEIFFLSEIEFIQGKIYKTLTDAVLLEKFSDMRDDLKRLAIAYKISEVLDNLIKGQEPDQKIWQLLTETFEKLNSLEIRNWKLEIIYHYFLWNLLSILGYKAELYNCVLCQKKLVPNKLYFSPQEGGAICEKCFQKVKKTEKIEPEVIKILRLIIKGNWKILSKLKVGDDLKKSLKFASENYLSQSKNQ